MASATASSWNPAGYAARWRTSSGNPSPGNLSPASRATGAPRSTKAYWKPRTCRICLEDVHPTFDMAGSHLPEFMQAAPKPVYETEFGRLISPCKCKGTTKYVHEQCLQGWRFTNTGSDGNIYRCGTCKFEYKLARIGWANAIKSRPVQYLIVVLISLAAVFLLGFPGDMIIGFYYDPYDPFKRILRLVGLSKGGLALWENDKTWGSHFLKGFVSLGLGSFMQSFLTPFDWMYRFAIGGPRRSRGRVKRGDIFWVAVCVGAATFMYVVLVLLNRWSRNQLQKASDKVMDIQLDDDDDE